jgi:hypothetical protein
MPLSQSAISRLDQLLGQPEVVGYAAEPITTQAGAEGIRIYLAAAASVDEEIDGLPVEALVVGRPERKRAEAEVGVGVGVNPKTKVRPLVGGISISLDDSGSGTLGYFVHKDKDLCVLSASHVLTTKDANVIQPSYRDGGKPGDDRIAKVSDTKDDPSYGVDAAYAKLAGAEAKLELNGIGYVGGTAGVKKDDKVFKSGKMTGVTEGVVDAVEVKIRFGTDEYEHQIAIKGKSGAFSTGGDSGSLVVDDKTKAVGLLMGGTDAMDYANPIDRVLAKLGVTLAL